jgi:hypothetical protein
MIDPAADGPSRWRQLAEDARAVAEQMKDPVARKMMMRVVEGYERLAEHAKRRRASATTETKIGD